MNELGGKWSYYVKEIKVPLPSNDVQNEIISRIQQELQLISVIKQLITIFE